MPVQSLPSAIRPARTGGGAPTYDGCPVFPPGDRAYNQDISATPLDPNSAQYIQSLGSNKSWDFDTDEYLNTANASVKKLPVQQDVPWHSEPPEPWLSSYLIEPLSDGHSFVLDTSACHIYELYETAYSQGTLSAYSGGDWNLRKPYVNHPPGQSTAVAGGDSMFAGAVKYPELAAGEVDHALFLIVPYNMLSQWNYVRPAASTDGIPYKGPGPDPMPYGAKLRLRANFSETGLGPQALAVVHALKTYGAIVSDTGCCYKFIFMNDPATANAFNLRDLDSLESIQPTDWGVVKLRRVRAVQH
ncbi:MAG TPA: hypothetical protein VGF86_04085 [Candidatus Tumulicola sp.]